jgi:diguanylate cyclase (GGDEF)-like protein
VPAVATGVDAWDNLILRAQQPISLSSWTWLVFDGAAPVFLLLLLRALAERDAAVAELQALASTDPLTGLPNRRAFLAAAQAAIATAWRQSAPLSVMLIDLDRFKAINDRHGHPAGDAVLRATAEVLRATLRRTDLPVRWGGEEFAALLPFTGTEEAATLAERLRYAVRALVPHPGGDAAGPVTISVGIAAITPAVTADSALAAGMGAADAALYAAKTQGRDRVALAAPPPGDAMAAAG